MERSGEYGDVRPAGAVLAPQAVVEGAGVRLGRTIGLPRLSYLDPFLLLDHFASDDPADYIAGFPMHPHRGIETVTYMLAGSVAHKDTMGNEGVIGQGDVQWMTAGGGLLHEEMPQPADGMMAGFQLWVNLPAAQKMMPPRYRDVPHDTIPTAELAGGARVGVIAGKIGETVGPVHDIVAQPTYFDVRLYPDAVFDYWGESGETTFLYLFEGTASIGRRADDRHVAATSLVVLEEGRRVLVKALGEGARFLFVAGRPLGEPIARYGPFVMNTREEIEQALRDLRDGTFVREADGAGA
jgi:quercetin 2,3-dioxygenase